MDSVNDLALKGFFHSLKDEANREATKESQKYLLHLLEKAVGMIEEVYEKDPALLHPDNAGDYREIIEALNQYGLQYKGNKAILDLAVNYSAPGQKPVTPEKMPMQKATGSRKKTKEERLTGIRRMKG